MKVIIADYDEEAIRLFEEQCKQFSYVELSGKFNDSAETLKYVSRHRVEAAFINIELNGMDGLQLGDNPAFLQAAASISIMYCGKFGLNEVCAD